MSEVLDAALLPIARNELPVTEKTAQAASLTVPAQPTAPHSIRI
jgi:hypothetical protein